MGNQNSKWSGAQTAQVSDFLTSIAFPKEITRQLRGLDEIPRWKGVEFRTFLLYASVVALKIVFAENEEIYVHFLHLLCAIIICSRTDQSIGNYEVARKLLLDFLHGVKILYGENLFTSNMHSLCHLVDDVLLYGPLDNF